MKKLIETLEFQMGHNPAVGIILDNQLSEWGNVPYAELSIIIVHLRFLAMIHQTHHWISRGDTYYGDHLLFERLYNETNGELDGIAERAVGLGYEQNVNVSLQALQLMKLVQGYGAINSIPQPTELAKRSLQAEKTFLVTVDACVESLKEKGKLTRGLDNLLAGIEDVHESHVYLLKQRSTEGGML